MVRLATTLLILATAGIIGSYYFYDAYLSDLPDYARLVDYRPPTATRIHAGDGRLFAEFSAEHRVFVPIESMPKLVITAFLAAEDKNFYSHPGIDPLGILRASLTNLTNMATGRRPMGASTITQQVAKNLLLTNEVSITRKIREGVLAMRIEHAMSKDRILELYLNEIYLGNQSYGVASAAQNYFNKSLDTLTIAEAAFLAALPKGPNNYNPERQHEAAVGRRNWVLGRMAADGYLTATEAAAAQAEPLLTRHRDSAESVFAPDYALEVRRQLVRLVGERQVLEGGLSVRTALDPRLQDITERALRGGLISYDRRHGWRGPVAHLSSLDDWPRKLGGLAMPKGGEAWRLAVILGTRDTKDTKDTKGKDGETAIGFADGRTGVIPFSEMKWARLMGDDARTGPEPKHPREVVRPGDVVLVEASGALGSFALRQIPEVQGGLVAMDPHTGRVLAMVGGFSPAMSQFNRATQAMRQPGSAFKPFVYLTALANGFTPSSLVLDAPFEYAPGFGQPIWRPENFHQRFFGPTPLRVGIEKSRNLMTVRLAQTIGMEKVKATVETFGIVDNLEPYLPMALGAAETTVLRLTTAYAMLVNGGKRLTPALIDRVQDRDGKTVYRHDNRTCQDCAGRPWQPGRAIPELPDLGAQIEDPRLCYQIVNIMTGVVQRGTASRLNKLGRPLGGKTGTTNDSNDVWFVGFTPDLVVGLYVGFDQPRSLGDKETGGSTAVPIFEQIISEALKDKPSVPFRVPPGIRLVRIQPESGQPAEPGDRTAILEAFLPGSEPGGEAERAPAATANTQPTVSPGLSLAPDSDSALSNFDSYTGSTAMPAVGSDADRVPASSGVGRLY